ncbi:ASPH [Lepeophtheirus salmonis]|uniref:ASPH n=1 Tax=Lepeophtheirus salmonis TaxID=72036 RepID=A0A7R8CR08_LEPSM|nr:ASPH [Lepeophtheirus salmonis]CAF2900582.1 ASPH [Lepeophtheirus salmonis]
MEAKIKAEQETKLKAERVAQLKSEEESNSLKKNMRKQKVSEDPSEIRSKIQDKESPSQDDLELKRKLENERLMKENLGNEKNTNSSQVDKRLITNSEDALIMDLLDSADEILEYDPQSALKKFEEILTTSPRAFYGKAMALKKMAELQRSNPKLEMAIDTFQTLLAMGDLVPDALYRMAGEEVVRLLKFRGWNNKAIKTMKLLRIRFPADISFSKEIGVLHLIMGQNEDARIVFEDIRKKHPKDGFTLAHLGFVRKVLAKSDHDLEAAVSFLKRGIATRAEVNPVWTLSETKIKDDLEKIRVEWEKVRDEVLKVKNGSGFLQESENLLDSGSWQQFEIYKQGRKVKNNCLLTPFTCSLFEHFPPARTNTRGQIKFSIMSDNTHVHAHCGPTNTRLRIHLPLVVPSTADSSNLKLRVTDKYLTWKEGEFLIFDDSFDHEVWNNSGGERLVLIFDIWHPEITSEQAATLPPM